MPTYKVAHVKEQGIDLIIIPLESNFGRKTKQQQDEITSQLQIAANSAGLAGTVVPVWEQGAGRMAFRAPDRWHPFFKSLTWAQVLRSVNREISC